MENSTREFSERMLLRTKQFSIDVLKFCNTLEGSLINRPLIGQLVRSATSSGANYRATRRAKSKPDFIHKFKIVEEELDESLFFLELFLSLYPEREGEISPLQKEGDELLRIVVASLNKLKQ